MKINSDKTMSIRVVSDVICDRCNKSCKRKDQDNTDSVEYDANNCHYKVWDYAEMKSQWGYYSRKDLESHEIVLCEDCYDETLKVMGIKPKITYYL